LRGWGRRLRQPLSQLLLPRADAAGQGSTHAGGRDCRVQNPDADRGTGGPLSAATAYVLLEDGARFDGVACGAHAAAVGEIVFTTSMSGYQEAMSDPSYAGQLLTFTYPQVGNYGVSSQAMESARAHARAAIMRAAVDRDDAPAAEQGWLSWLADQGIAAITDVDTRALVRHIRDRGAMRGGIFPAALPEAHARELIEAEPGMAGRDLVREVTPDRMISLGDGSHVA